MPKRGRNRVEWARMRVDPKKYITDHDGFPVKVGDVVIGINSGADYLVMRNDVGMLRVKKVSSGTVRSIGIARDGRLHLAVQRERTNARNQVADLNDEIMKEYHRTAVDRQKARKARAEAEAEEAGRGYAEAR